jgi:glycerate kinase
MIVELDRNLAHYADVIKKSLHIDVKKVPAPVRRAVWAPR